MIAFYAGAVLGFFLGWIFCAMFTIGKGLKVKP